MKKTTRRHHGTMTELNITPLLDLVFVLLVIFIITTPQLMNNLELNLPSGKPPPKNPNPPKIHHITLNDKGVTMLDDAVVSAAQLKTELAALKAADPELSVVVKGADGMDYQYMVAVLDTLQQLEITKVGMATE
ncbi:MAG TPA: biopolymer transporter ExbD [Verrucomicrobiae bacterium]|jgi:biopolymer transport protein ExbD